MDKHNVIFSLIKSCLFFALIFITLVGGYMIGYQIRGAHAIYMINNILIHEAKNTTNNRTMLTCTRRVLQDSVRNFYLLPEYKYLEQFKECERELGSVKIEDGVAPVQEGIEEELGKPNKSENTESVLPYTINPDVDIIPYREIK